MATINRIILDYYVDGYDGTSSTTNEGNIEALTQKYNNRKIKRNILYKTQENLTSNVFDYEVLQSIGIPVGEPFYVEIQDQNNNGQVVKAVGQAVATHRLIDDKWASKGSLAVGLKYIFININSGTLIKIVDAEPIRPTHGNENPTTEISQWNRSYSKDRFMTDNLYSYMWINNSWSSVTWAEGFYFENFLFEDIGIIVPGIVKGNQLYGINYNTGSKAWTKKGWEKIPKEWASQQWNEDATFSSNYGIGDGSIYYENYTPVLKLNSTSLLVYYEREYKHASAESVYKKKSFIGGGGGEFDWTVSEDSRYDYTSFSTPDYSVLGPPGSSKAHGTLFGKWDIYKGTGVSLTSGTYEGQSTLTYMQLGTGCIGIPYDPFTFKATGPTPTRISPISPSSWFKDTESEILSMILEFEKDLNLSLTTKIFKNIVSVGFDWGYIVLDVSTGQVVKQKSMRDIVGYYEVPSPYPSGASYYQKYSTTWTDFPDEIDHPSSSSVKMPGPKLAANTIGGVMQEHFRTGYLKKADYADTIYDYHGPGAFNNRDIIGLRYGKTSYSDTSGVFANFWYLHSMTQGVCTSVTGQFRDVYMHKTTANPSVEATNLTYYIYHPYSDVIKYTNFSPWSLFRCSTDGEYIYFTPTFNNVYGGEVPVNPKYVKYNSDYVDEQNSKIKDNNNWAICLNYDLTLKWKKEMRSIVGEPGLTNPPSASKGIKDSRHGRGVSNIIVDSDHVYFMVEDYNEERENLVKLKKESGELAQLINFNRNSGSSKRYSSSILPQDVIISSSGYIIGKGVNGNQDFLWITN